MNRKQQETAKIKVALKALPYRSKVRHGTGTGSGWIKVYIPRKIWETEHRQVENMIAQATDRHGSENYIIVMWYE